MIDFNYTARGFTQVNTINSEIDSMVSVFVNTDTVIELLNDVITEWDMLSVDSQKNLTDLAGLILEISNE